MYTVESKEKLRHTKTPQGTEGLETSLWNQSSLFPPLRPCGSEEIGRVRDSQCAPYWPVVCMDVEKRAHYMLRDNVSYMLLGGS